MLYRALRMAVVLLPALASLLPAQTTFGVIRGRVLDSTGSTVARAEVTVTNTNTNVQKAAACDEIGSYEVGYLQPGTYQRLRYRAVNQHQDYRTLEMLPAGEGNVYQAEVPAAGIDPMYDFMCLIEVMDKAGNGRIYPDLEVETPCVVVKLSR